MLEPHEAAKLSAYEAALGFYANPDAWKGDGSQASLDAGKVARETIAAHAPKSDPGKVKCFAPEGISWHGKPLDVAEDGSCYLSHAALAELAPHGARLWTDEDEIALDKGDESDPANMSRKQLLAVVKGKGAGNVMLMTTDELRPLAVKVLAGESIAKEEPQPAPADGGEAEQLETAAVIDETKIEEPAPADGGE